MQEQLLSCREALKAPSCPKKGVTDRSECRKGRGFCEARADFLARTDATLPK